MASNTVAITGNRTLDGTQANRLVNVTATSVITIPKSDTYNYTNGDIMNFVRNTTGAVSFTPATGVTLLSKRSSRAISVQYGIAVLKKISENVWLLSGDI